VRRVQSFVVELEPSRQSAALEISYSGGKAPLDPGSVEEMLRLLEIGIDFSKTAGASRDRFAGVAERLRRYVGWDRIPVALDERGYHYFTFAGQVVNAVIARWAGLRSYDAREIVLRTSQAIDFSKLPTKSFELRLAATEAMHVPENLSIFQQLLPDELLERELVDVWLKTPVFGRTLERLRNAAIVQAPLSELAEICA